MNGYVKQVSFLNTVHHFACLQWVRSERHGPQRLYPWIEMYPVAVAWVGGSAALKDKVRHRDKGRFCSHVGPWQADSLGSRPPLRSPELALRACVTIHATAGCLLSQPRPRLGSAAVRKGWSDVILPTPRTPPKQEPSAVSADRGHRPRGKDAEWPLGTATQAHQPRARWP